MTWPLEDLVRDLAPRVLGTLVRRYGDFARCEDAVQEALLEAAVSWPRDGLPGHPQGWLTTVATRRYVDMVRSAVARERREQRVFEAVPREDLHGAPADAEPVRDDLLELLFLCCHPTLTPPAQMALTLRAVAGLTTTEIATAFLVPDKTMGQRISRAKQRLREAGARFELPPEHEQGPALRVVLHVLYLLFNEGYSASAGAQLHRPDLTVTAIRLTRLLLERLSDPSTTQIPEPVEGFRAGSGVPSTTQIPEPVEGFGAGSGVPSTGSGTGSTGSGTGSTGSGTGSTGSGTGSTGTGTGSTGSGTGAATGLLALMLLTEARSAARIGADGILIPLDEQDRSLWDQAAIAEGTDLVTRSLRMPPVGAYQLQAAIAAVHSEATSVEETDWPQILALYDLLERIEPNPVTLLNRAVALGEVRGPQAALDVVTELDRGLLAGHHRLLAVRAHLLEKAGDITAASEAFREAARLAASVPEQRFLRLRAARCESSVRKPDVDGYFDPPM